MIMKHAAIISFLTIAFISLGYAQETSPHMHSSDSRSTPPFPSTQKEKEMEADDSKVPIHGSFQGVYGGITGSLGYQRIRVNGQGFKITYPRLGINGGYGFLFNETGYLGLEAGGSKNWYRASRQGVRLTNPYEMEGLLRLGKVVEGNFLSYAGLGFSQERYRFHLNTVSKHFTSTSMIYEVGVDGFILPHTLIRSSVRYERSVHVSSDPGITVNKKPHSVMLKIGVIFKL